MSAKDADAYLAKLSADKRATLEKVRKAIRAAAQGESFISAELDLALNAGDIGGAPKLSAQERRVIVVDGFITSAAVLVAARLQPHVLQRCVFAHGSAEPGHAHMLAHLLPGQQPQPLLDLGLRLGEGSGAALAWPLLESACRVLNEMASFASAGVSQRHE